MTKTHTRSRAHARARVHTLTHTHHTTHTNTHTHTHRIAYIALTTTTDAGIFAMCTIVSAHRLGRTLPDGGLAAEAVDVVQKDGAAAFSVGRH